MIQNSKRFNTVKLSLLSAMILAAGTVYAQGPNTGGGPVVSTDTNALSNPYSPRANGHSYRHGVLPTIDVLKQMRQWESQNHPITQATNSPTLSYGGGTSGVGVGSGQVKVYLV